MTGQLYCLSAPSGAGKSSLVKALLAQDAQIRVSVSHTTRAPRPGEVAGQDYHFVDHAQFLSMIQGSEFLEHAQVFDHFYGTSQQQVKQLLQQGLDVILEIDWQGAEQVRRLMPEVISIFILPPSLAALAERLHKRGQDSQEVINKRLAKSQEEMSHYPEFDYLLVNDDFNQSLAQLAAIFTGLRLRASKMVSKEQNLLKQLLS